MNYSKRKKIIIICIIAIIININIDHGNAQYNNIIKNSYEWFRIYMSKIILKMNISNIKQISHKKWNKLIKIINGNRVYKKPVKTKRHFKVVVWNKGNYNFNSDSDKFLAIKTEILNQNGDLIILSEAEFNPSDEDHIKGEFPNYDIFYKLIPGAIKARILVLVKKDTINITRLTQIEQAETAWI